MARTKNTGPERKAVSVSLTMDNFKVLDEHKWDQRKTLSELVDSIVGQYIDANGLRPAPVVEDATKKA